jgi:hypothetical protein
MAGPLAPARPGFWPARLPSPLALGALVICVYYTFAYLAFGGTPGNDLVNGGQGFGWLGWYDQGKTYNSALALASGDFDVGAHWYPFGYALLAAPFVLKMHAHAFFFVDLAGLLLAYWGFVAFARRVGVPVLFGVLLFLLASVDLWIVKQWIIPWSSTPSAALCWLLLATTAAHMQGTRRPLALGLLAAPLPLMRPMDLLIAGPCLLWAAWTDIRTGRLQWPDVVLVIAGGLVVVLPYAALHIHIYGWHASPYMVMSRQLGFTVHHPIWRAYTLFIEPREWFLLGNGLLQRFPWLVIGLAGILLAWRDRALALLAFCLVIYCGIYLCYIDLLPSGLWRFNNVHYFKWTMPGFALLGALLLRDLLAPGWGRPWLTYSRPRRMQALVALVVVVVVSGLHLAPREVPITDTTRTVAIDIVGEHTNDENAYFGPLFVHDNGGNMENIYQMRVLPTPDGMRLIALRRDFLGPVTWIAGHSPAGPLKPEHEIGYAIQTTIGWPCWLPPYACQPVDFQVRDDPLSHESHPVTKLPPSPAAR